MIPIMRENIKSEVPCKTRGLILNLHAGIAGRQACTCIVITNNTGTYIYIYIYIYIYKMVSTMLRVTGPDNTQL